MAHAEEILVTGSIGNAGSALFYYLDNTGIRVLTHDEPKARSLK